MYNAELVPPMVDNGETRRTRPRYYTVRECARLQGFLRRSIRIRNRGYHELGNSVCVPLVRRLGRRS